MVPHMQGATVSRLPRLLNILYKPSELAEELGIPVEWIYRAYIPAGAPHKLDAAGRIWIPGRVFADWARTYLASDSRGKPPEPMPDNYAYCLHCRMPVPIQNSRSQPHHYQVVQITGRCPQCGARVNRFRSAQG